VLTNDDFMEALNSMSAPLPEDDVKKLIMAHEKSKDSGIDFAEFMAGKKYVNKLYLMSSFDGKKKKKKGGKGGESLSIVLVLVLLMFSLLLGVLLKSLLPHVLCLLSNKVDFNELENILLKVSRNSCRYRYW